MLNYQRVMTHDLGTTKQKLMFAVLPDEVSFSKDRRGPFYCEVQILLTLVVPLR